MSIGENIRKARQSKRMTQAQLAEILKTTPQNINQYENNRRNPKTETIVKMAEALQVPVTDLLPEDMQISIINLFSGVDVFKEKYNKGISIYDALNNLDTKENINRRVLLKDKLLKQYQCTLDFILSDINHLQIEANDLRTKIKTLEKEINSLKEELNTLSKSGE